MSDRKTVSQITDDELTALYDRCEELALLLDLANGLPSMYRIRKVEFLGTTVVRAHQIEPIYADTDTKAAADA